MLSYLSKPALVYLLALTFFLGTFLGSALHCLAYRMVRGQKWSCGRSQCPACGHVLGAMELLPVISWLLLRSKCRHCGKAIPIRYLLSELTLGLGFTALLLRYDLTIQLLSSWMLTANLFCLSLVDWESQIIPHRFLAIPAGFRVLELLWLGGIPKLCTGLIPAVLFGGSLFALSLTMDAVLKRESLGGGDIKLVALLGLYFSIPECLFLLFIACLLGIFGILATKTERSTPFPFAPALSIAAFCTLLFGQAATQWYFLTFF